MSVSRIYMTKKDAVDYVIEREGGSMSYWLDGIETAMVLTEHEVSGGSGQYVQNVVCPCGWARLLHLGLTAVGIGLDSASLRFHYEHCPQARAAPPAESLAHYAMRDYDEHEKAAERRRQRAASPEGGER